VSLSRGKELACLEKAENGLAVPRSPRLLRTLGTIHRIVPHSKTGISAKREFIAYLYLHQKNYQQHH
jgi:hypothetical protein